MGSPCGSAGKESTCNVGELGSIPGLRRSPGEDKGYYSSILAWRISRTVYSTGSQRVRRDRMTFTSLVPIKILPILQGVAQVAMPVLTQGFTTLVGNIFSVCCYSIAQR